MIRNSIWQRNLLWLNVKATPIHVHTYPIHQNRYDSSTVVDESTHRKSNPALTYRRSRGVSKVWKWVAWKEKMIIWTFRVLKVWNGWKSIVRISLILKWTFFLPKALNRGINCWRIDTIRAGRHDSSLVKSIRLTGSRFAKEDNTYLSFKLGYSFDSTKSCYRAFPSVFQIDFRRYDGLTSTVRNRSIRQYLQPPFVATCGLLSKCLANWLSIWRINIICDESFDSTISATPFRGHLRNIFCVLQIDFRCDGSTSAVTSRSIRQHL